MNTTYQIPPPPQVAPLSHNPSTVFANHRDQPVPAIAELLRLKNKWGRSYLNRAESESGLSKWKIRLLLKLQPVAAPFHSKAEEEQPTLKELKVLKTAAPTSVVQVWGSLLEDRKELKAEGREISTADSMLILKRWAVQT